MAAVKAINKQVGISPKRVRLVLNAIKGMPVQQALDRLQFTPGPTASKVAAVLRSAASNAENNAGMDPSRLKVVNAYADQAVKMRRFRANSRGRVGRVEREASHITILVDEAV